MSPRGILEKIKIPCPCQKWNPGSPSPQPRHYNDYSAPATVVRNVANQNHKKGSEATAQFGPIQAVKEKS